MKKTNFTLILFVVASLVGCTGLTICTWGAAQLRNVH
jgi:hypothetical protein